MKESKSLKLLKQRFNIAQKYNYDISLKGIKITNDIKDFIIRNRLFLNKEMDRLTFKDIDITIIYNNYFNSIINPLKLFKIINDNLNNKPKIFIDSFKENNRLHALRSVCGQTHRYSNTIYLNLHSLKEPLRTCQTISHEILHQLLYNEGYETSHKWDNIAEKLRYDGYLGGFD